MTEINKLAAFKAFIATVASVLAIAGFALSQVFFAAQFWTGVMILVIVLCVVVMLSAVGRFFYSVFDPATKMARKQERARLKHKEIERSKYCFGECGWSDCRHNKVGA